MSSRAVLPRRPLRPETPIATVSPTSATLFTSLILCSGEVPSPAGPLLAQAGSEGYDTSGVRVPYHGYYYRMLANGTGFGFVAYPADYHESGIMTFQVSETGVVYQKDLGDATSALVQAMTVYQVDSTWAEVPADE